MAIHLPGNVQVNRKGLSWAWISAAVVMAKGLLRPAPGGLLVTLKSVPQSRRLVDSVAGSAVSQPRTARCCCWSWIIRGSVINVPPPARSHQARAETPWSPRLEQRGDDAYPATQRV